MGEYKIWGANKVFAASIPIEKIFPAQIRSRIMKGYGRLALDIIVRNKVTKLLSDLQSGSIVVRKDVISPNISSYDISSRTQSE